MVSFGSGSVGMSIPAAANSFHLQCKACSCLCNPGPTPPPCPSVCPHCPSSPGVVRSHHRIITSRASQNVKQAVGDVSKYVSICFFCFFIVDKHVNNSNILIEKDYKYFLGIFPISSYLNTSYFLKPAILIFVVVFWKSKWCHKPLSWRLLPDSITPVILSKLPCVSI